MILSAGMQSRLPLKAAQAQPKPLVDEAIMPNDQCRKKLEHPNPTAGELGQAVGVFSPSGAKYL
jgi:hypothetical protein